MTETTQRPVKLETVRDAPLVAATIFLFGDIDWREKPSEYRAKLAELDRILESQNYRYERDITAEVKMYVNPAQVNTGRLFFGEHRKVAVVRAYGREEAHDQGRRLRDIGITTPTFASVNYSFMTPWNFNSGIVPSVFTIGKMTDSAKEFSSRLGLDFLLTEFAADIEYGKLSMNKPIYQQILAAGHAEQPLRSYSVEEI